MLVVIVAVVLAGAAVVVLLSGVSASTGGHGDGGAGRRRVEGTLPGLVTAGGAGVLVLVVLVGGGVLVARGGGHRLETTDPANRSGPAATTPPTSPTTDVFAPTAASAEGRARRGPAVRVRAADEATFAGVPVVDRLVDGTVLRVTAGGFVPDTDGTVAICRNGPSGPARCLGAFPVRFDGAGTARFQYLVVRDGTGRCGPDDGCVLAVTDAEGRLGTVATVFGAAAPAPGRVTITPRTGLEDGQAVQVLLTGFPPGAHVRLAQCVPPGQPVARRCGAPGPVVPVVVGDDGRASASFAVRAGSVGSGHHPCLRGRVCAVAVTTADGAVPAPVVPITFSAGRGASYDGGRLIVGLLVAIALACLATWLVRTTDWREPSEAATPELDAATFGDL
ncbi:MAG: neocarzinostatin apoprotein domain-containing protein [Actinomycetota bacterium]